MINSASTRLVGPAPIVQLFSQPVPSQRFLYLPNPSAVEAWNEARSETYS